MPLLTRLRDRLLPPFCALCRQSADSGHYLCSGCEADLPWILSPCLQCGLPLNSPEGEPQHCGYCLKTPPPWQRLTSPCLYQWPITNLVTRFKYQGDLIAGRALVKVLGQHLLNYYSGLEKGLSDGPEWPDILIPVPLHWRRRWQRGFNQAEWLANGLIRHLDQDLRQAWGENNRSRASAAHYLPAVNKKICRRIRFTPNQQGLSKMQRTTNLKRSFDLRSGLEGRSVALLDDVVTTGSTAAEICRLLTSAGASSIDVWSLCRTSPLE